MKKYYFHTSKYSNQELGSIREQYDIVSYLLSVMTILNVEPLREIDSKEADLVIFVDKMSRLFWGEEDKIHSMTEDEMLYLTIHIQKITEDHKRLKNL